MPLKNGIQADDGTGVRFHRNDGIGKIDFEPKAEFCESPMK
jgi:hypothetical protein